MSASPPATEKDGSGDDVYQLVHLWFTAIGLLSIALISLVLSQFSGAWAAVGIGALIALASGCVGAFLGFLFAIPRLLSQDSDNSKAATAPTSATDRKKRFLSSNTNLDQVSNWLTTMLVGVGLTQLTHLNAALLEFRDFLRDTVHVFPGGTAGTLPSVGPMLLIVGTAVGFVALYLFTRLELSPLFQKVEENLNKLSEDRIDAVKGVARDSGAVENPAVQAILASPQPSIADIVSLMMSLLYQKDGYQKVIDLGGQLSTSPARQRADYWFYLAAAFGQKYHALLQQDVSTAELSSAKDNALDCARRAVAIDPSYKTLLAAISNPGSTDDNLADFSDMPEFKKIVKGRSA